MSHDSPNDGRESPNNGRGRTIGSHSCDSILKHVTSFLRVPTSNSKRNISIDDFASQAIRDLEIESKLGSLRNQKEIINQFGPSSFDTYVAGESLPLSPINHADSVQPPPRSKQVNNDDCSAVGTQKLAILGCVKQGEDPPSFDFLKTS